MKVYIKLFLGTGIPFAVFAVLFQGAGMSFPARLVGGLFSGLCFGLSMSLVLGLMHQWSIKRTPSTASAGNSGVHQVRSIRLSVPADAAFDLCKASLQTILKASVSSEDRSAGRIVAKAGMTWKTWGDRITFDVRSCGNGESQVDVSSRPLLRTVLVDCGKNLTNVEAIVAYLTSRSAGK